MAKTIQTLKKRVGRSTTITVEYPEQSNRELEEEFQDPVDSSDEEDGRQYNGYFEGEGSGGNDPEDPEDEDPEEEDPSEDEEGDSEGEQEPEAGIEDQPAGEIAPNEGENEAEVEGEPQGEEEPAEEDHPQRADVEPAFGNDEPLPDEGEAEPGAGLEEEDYEDQGAEGVLDEDENILHLLENPVQVDNVDLLQVALDESNQREMELIDDLDAQHQRIAQLEAQLQHERAVHNHEMWQMQNISRERLHIEKAHSREDINRVARAIDHLQGGVEATAENPLKRKRIEDLFRDARRRGGLPPGYF